MKIAYFPDFYPDELVYSVAARYIDHLQFPSQIAGTRNLFGKHTKGASIDFPYGLQNLLDEMPPHHAYSIDGIIQKFTLYPYYAPFLHVSKAQFIYEQMKWSGIGIYSAAGTSNSNIIRPRWLRYCPVCVESERKLLGECYWHRLHQIAGVIICPIHHVYLEDCQLGAAYMVHPHLPCSAITIL